ncbi:MAG: hypothetical protein ABJE66_05005 [Deltaproteobacteria bacterium]
MAESDSPSIEIVSEPRFVTVFGPWIVSVRIVGAGPTDALLEWNASTLIVQLPSGNTEVMT